MKTLPFLRLFQSDQTIAWYNGEPISSAKFLSHVADCLEILPDKQHVLNLCADRYLFLVGFAAALVRGQITLLPPSRAPKIIELIGQTYPDTYYLTDCYDTVPGLKGFSLSPLRHNRGSSTDIPLIPAEQVATIAFTSGSTGQPRPNPKTWESLVSIARKTGARIAENNKVHLTVVATVPHQHMYGLETSIMLPIQHGWAFYSGRPFFPEDISSILSKLPSQRLLTSTPIHLRACVMERTQFPPLESILSATAPLSESLAQQAEALFQTRIIEIYGFAEAGTVATRRTSTDEKWKLLGELSLLPQANGYSVKTPYFPDPISIPDSITYHGPQEFVLKGRPGNLVNIGGHRASLDDLTHQLISIEGVRDGIFCNPDEGNEVVSRLIAFAVAPESTSEQILSTLRNKINPVFLPRPLYLVDSLPRNPTGKLPKECLESLVIDQTHTQRKE